MKRMFIGMLALMMPVLLMAQNKSVDRVFNKYAGQDGFTTVYISKYMFSLFQNLEGMEDKEAKEISNVLGDLEGIRILAADDEAGIGKGINFYDEMMKDLPRDEFKELMVIKETDSDVVFLAREEKGQIIELLLIVSGDDSNVLISIEGKINLNTISKLSQGMGIEAMEELEKLEK